jgi:hypothetical protein
VEQGEVNFVRHGGKRSDASETRVVALDAVGEILEEAGVA